MQTPIETETLVQLLLDCARVFGDLKDRQIKMLSRALKRYQRDYFMPFT